MEYTDDCPGYMSAADPTALGGRRLCLLYMVDINNQCYNDDSAAGLDLSDCNPEISHTLNNEDVGANQMPGSDAKATDYGKLIQDDFIVLTFDVPYKAWCVYQDLYSYAKYGLMAQPTSSAERIKAGQNGAQQPSPGRYFRLVIGPEFENCIVTKASGANKQYVDLGFMVFPKSITWEIKPGRKDFITIRFTGKIVEPEEVANPHGEDDTWWGTLWKLALTVVGGRITGSPMLGWYTWEQLKAFRDGETQTPGGPPT